MKYINGYEFEGLTDDVCNTRQMLNKLIAEFDINTIPENELDRQNYANCIKHLYNAISGLRQIEILLEI